MLAQLHCRTAHLHLTITERVHLPLSAVGMRPKRVENRLKLTQWTIVNTATRHCGITCG